MGLVYKFTVEDAVSDRCSSSHSLGTETWKRIRNHQFLALRTQTFVLVELSGESYIEGWQRVIKYAIEPDQPEFVALMAKTRISRARSSAGFDAHLANLEEMVFATG